MVKFVDERIQKVIVNLERPEKSPKQGPQDAR